MKTFAEKINVLVRKGYLEDAARANWLQIKPEVAMTGIVDFVLNLGK